MKRALLSPVAIGLTLLTFLALIGCAKAGIWQYHRGVIRHDANAQVKSNISLAPISETEFSELTKNLGVADKPMAQRHGHRIFFART